MKTNYVWQSRYNGEDFIKIEAMSRSRKSARVAPCWRDGRRIPQMRVRTMRASTIEAKFRRYFSTESAVPSHCTSKGKP